MKKNRITLNIALGFLLLFLNGATKGQGFDKIYSFSPYPEFSIFSSIRSVLADANELYVLSLTYKDTLIANNYSSLTTSLSSFDYAGHLNWERQINFPESILYEATEPYFLHLLAKVKENKYVLGSVGWDTINVAGYATPRPYLLFFDNQGDSLRFVSIPYGTSDNLSFIHAIGIDQAQNVLASGQYRNQVFADTIGIWLAKFDSSGNFLWRKVIPNQVSPSGDAYATKVISSNMEDGYLVGGIHKIGHYDSTWFALWKFDTAGNLLWRKNLPRALNEGALTYLGSEQFFDIIPANNGSGYYFMAADLQRVEFPDEGTGFLPIYYCGKLDEEGEVVWAKTYERDTFHKEQCMGLKQQPNGDLIFLGKSSWNGPWSEEGQEGVGASVFSTDSLGNVKWFKVIKRYNCPTDVGHFLHSMDLTPHGGIALGGYIGQFNAQPSCYDSTDAIAWLVLTDSMGRRDPSDTATFTLNADSVVYPADTTAIVLVEDKDRPQLRLYPNPAGNTVYAELLNLPSGNGKAMLHLYDHLGRQLKQQVLEGSKTAVDISAYPPGLYYIRLRYQDKDVGGYKLVKE